MTMSHPVITDVGLWGDPAHVSSVVKALAHQIVLTTVGTGLLLLIFRKPIKSLMAGVR